MWIIACLALLSSPDYGDRECGSRLACALPYDVLTAAKAGSDDPEVRARLQVAIDRAFTIRVNALLPDEHPFWPDRDNLPFDYERWIKIGDECGLYKSDWIARWQYKGGTPPTYPAYRMCTVAVITDYVRKTGDWLQAKAWIDEACCVEQAQSYTPPAPMVWYALWMTDYTLLKRSR